ncbi:MAG: sensor histidine kinase [Ardenticatenaceae bacterium]
MRTLRSRLMVSHVVPLLLIIPLVGLILLYLLETQLLLLTLTSEMKQQANLIVALTADRRRLWDESVEAQEFIDELRLPANVRLVNRQHELLAGDTNPEEPATKPGLSQALAGEVYEEVSYNQVGRLNLAVIWVPVKNSAGEVLGAVRIERKLSTLVENTSSFRYVMGVVMVGAIILGGLIGSLLAFTLVRPLRSVTSAAYRLSSGEQKEFLSVTGPEEVRVLIRAVNTLIGRLRVLENNRRKLLGNLIHELGRPLGSMQAAIEALQRGADKDELFRRELFGGMAGEIQRLERLLENLSQLRYQAQGTFELKRQPLNPNQWLPEVISPWRVSATQKGLDWQATIPPDLPALNADPDRLGQVLGNLLSNAVKYTAAGAITLEVAHQKDKLLIRISNTGYPISKEEQEKLFQPFYRSRTHKRFPQGMGLGLPIAQEIARTHGGDLTLHTDEQGNHFTLSLPIMPT